MILGFHQVVRGWVSSCTAPSLTTRDRYLQPAGNILETNMLHCSNLNLKLVLVYEIPFPFVETRDDIVEESGEVLQ